MTGTIAYKATPLREYVSRVFLVHCTAIQLSSPLASTLYLLPKDQTLKGKSLKATKESPYIAEHFSHNQTTLSPYDLVSSPRIAQAPHEDLSSDDPVVS